MPRPPQPWTTEELAADAAEARQRFVQERLAALGHERRVYEGWIDEYSADVAVLLAATDDLLHLDGGSIRDRRVLDTLRYAVSPVVSLDDLDTITDGCFGLWVGQRTQRGRAPTDRGFADAASFFAERIDRTRAVWLDVRRRPTAEERETFVRGTASLRAMGAVSTARRIEGSKRQEKAARAAAKRAGYTPLSDVPGTLSDPINELPPGSFVTASRRLADTNMDIPVRLSDDHPTGLLFLALEAKVSNSSLNSRKRLLEVTRKRERWDASASLYRSRTGAVLAGVFEVRRLLETQEAGVFLFWEHRLQDLTDFLR